MKRIPGWIWFLVGTSLFVLTVSQTVNTMTWYKPKPIPTSALVRFDLQYAGAVIFFVVVMAKWLKRAFREERNREQSENSQD